jgi:DNA-binding NtrC family response regulator
MNSGKHGLIGLVIKELLGGRVRYNNFWNTLLELDNIIHHELTSFIDIEIAKKLTVSIFFYEGRNFHYYGYINAPDTPIDEIIRAHCLATAPWNKSTIAIHYLNNYNTNRPIAEFNPDVQSDPFGKEKLFDQVLGQRSMLHFSIPSLWPVGNLLSEICISYRLRNFQSLNSEEVKKCIISLIENKLKNLSSNEIPSDDEKPWHDQNLGEKTCKILESFGIYGSSKAFIDMANFAVRASRVFSNVLIMGLKGTGKGVLAKAIHRLGHSKDREPFITCDLNAVPFDIVESHLFGHEKGAFTGATERKIGLCKIVRKGTLFLDEIGNLKEEIQNKLNGLIEDKEFRPVGSTKTEIFEARIICATNKDLEKEINVSFSEGLYDRINIMYYTVPPLKERIEDVGEIAMGLLGMMIKYYMERMNIKNKIHFYRSGFSIRTINSLISIAQAPNNFQIRSIRSAIERALSQENTPGSLIELEDLKLDLPFNFSNFSRSKDYDIVDSDLKCPLKKCPFILYDHNEEKIKAANILLAKKRYPKIQSNSLALKLGKNLKTLKDREKDIEKVISPGELLDN